MKEIELISDILWEKGETPDIELEGDLVSPAGQKARMRSYFLDKGEKMTAAQEQNKQLGAQKAIFGGLSGNK